jgi:hypothetical protein
MAQDKKNQGNADQPSGEQGGGPGALKAPVDPALTRTEEPTALAQQPMPMSARENPPGDKGAHHTHNHEQYSERGERSAAYQGNKSPHYFAGQRETDLTGKVVPVNNNTNSVLQVQLTGYKDSKGAFRPGGLLSLIPGVNFISAEDLVKARENAIFAGHFTTKIAPSPAPEATPDRVGHFALVEMAGAIDKTNPLSSVADEEKAVDIVGEMGDARMIRQALDVETRPRVVAALKAQLKAIESPVVKKAPQ